jgi:hypothetical protein
LEIAGEDFPHLLFQLLLQVSVVKKLDGLFETYSDKEPYDDRGNVEEEAVPSAQCFMRCVDF